MSGPTVIAWAVLTIFALTFTCAVGYILREAKRGNELAADSLYVATIFVAIMTALGIFLWALSEVLGGWAARRRG